MRQKKNMLSVRTMKARLLELEVIAECLFLSMMMAAGTVGIVLIFAGISVEDFGLSAYARFSIVATVVFFTIFMGNYLDKRQK